MGSVIEVGGDADSGRLDRAGGGSRGSLNIATRLEETARAIPAGRSIVWRSGRTGDGRAIYSEWTFERLNRECDAYAHGLVSAGIGRGMRTILMVRPSAPFFALTFALYKIGAVPVLIDPGMGKGQLAACLSAVSAEGFVGIPLSHMLRVWNRRRLRTIHVVVTVGRKWGWGGARLDRIRDERAGAFESAATRADDPAAIIFTTGSTGPPKGVLYRHGMFDAQVRMLRDAYGIERGEVDLPTFPLFGLFDPALGMTAVLPEMDFTRPGRADGRKIVEAIADLKVTHMFGSPALIDRVGRFGESEGVRLPSLRRVISAGAPARREAIARFAKMLDGGAEIHTPYGATEALPVASIGSREILGETAEATSKGAGTCVGRPVAGMEVRVIRISDEAIGSWEEGLEVESGVIGEIVVSGEAATREYVTSGGLAGADDGGTVANGLGKIREGSRLWHRMGDVGYFDERGRLWFCGRKAHRVETESGVMFTEPVEGILNEHPAVFRTALVGVGCRPRQRAVVCVELKRSGGRDRKGSRETVLAELMTMARGNSVTRSVEAVMLHPGFPVDIRHNAKIFREKLAVWASERLR